MLSSHGISVVSKWEDRNSDYIGIGSLKNIPGIRMHRNMEGRNRINFWHLQFLAVVKGEHVIQWTIA